VSIVYAGKIAEKKGVLSLMRSLAYLDEPPGSVAVTCAGGAGNEEEYRRIREEAEKSRYGVTFTGALDQRALAAIFNRSDIFVLPSFYEGVPLSAVEALACGCRAVISDLPGVREWLEEFVPGADVRYVALPEIRNTDEPVPEELPGFERRLAEALTDCIRAGKTVPADVSGLSWEKIAETAIMDLSREL
jgi:glycosyltransferase involved in cell wall biosynthesis